MDAVHRPIVHACRPQGAAIAAAPVEDAPGIERVIFVLPGGLEDFPEMMWLLLAQAKGFPIGPERGGNELCHRRYLVQRAGSRRSWAFIRMMRTGGCGLALL